ncbi:MAG: pyruvate dehydrogenase (acetyl-transferring) E1 component subunit alpha [Candidatus Rokuibacteriota bacterium]
MPRTPLKLPAVHFLSILDADGRVDRALEPAIPPDDFRRLYRTFLLARRFDERMLTLQRQGRIGTYLSARGHEAAVLGSVYALRPTDWLVPVWREWPAYVWRGWPLESLIFLYAGLTEGTRVPDGCRDLPVCVPMGTHVPHAVGLAYAARYKREDSVTLCYFGDGASSEGVCQEALNFAGVFELPLVFVCVNNQWAISVPRARQTRAETIAQKAAAHGFPGIQVDGNDLLAVCVATREAVDRARRGGGPTLIEAVTYRLGAHSTADDPTKYRDEAEVTTWETKEPLPRFRRYLETKGFVDERFHAAMEAEVDAEVRAAIERAEARMPAAKLGEMFDHVYAELPAEVEVQHRALAPHLAEDAPGEDRSGADRG